LRDSEIEQILDEDTLIDTLERSKQTASEINSRMERAIIVTEEIATTRAAYKIVAIRGSILYFVIADMARINEMY
jgi:dynein heavy chain